MFLFDHTFILNSFGFVLAVDKKPIRTTTADYSTDPYQTFDYVSPKKKNIGQSSRRATTQRPLAAPKRSSASKPSAAEKKALLILSKSGFSSPAMAALKSEVMKSMRYFF